MINEDEIKQQALIDNTAQAIFNHLKEIENKREIYEKHWIWELVQNALDAVLEQQKIKVEINKNDSEITFKHNGRPFTPEEVAHLIYHGSTKREQDIGKFGTGFLTTHLLSREVVVKGVRKDGKNFRFQLDRNGVSPDKIKDCMEKTWEEYKASLNEIRENSIDYTAEYRYPLNDVSSKTVEAGIKDLIKIAPYVLAFNDKLGAIKITESSRQVRFELVNERNETGYIHKIVKEEEVGKSTIDHELWVVKSDDEVEIAVKWKKQNDGVSNIEGLHDIPKIFLAFPLFGTQDLPFPAVINSRKFEPTEKRDGIFLGREDTDDIKQNKRLLEKANELFTNLVSKSDGWENIHTLLNFGTPPKKDWLDEKWYKDLLKNCIGELRKLRVLKTESGSFITPDDGFIPFFDSLDEEKINQLWDLYYRFLSYKDKIPAKALVFEWAQIINQWMSIDFDLFFDLPKVTIEKLTEEIEGCRNLQDFKSKLSQDKDVFETLNDFYKLLLDSKRNDLFDSKSILPDQNGNFKKKPELFKDEGIDNTLKDISNKLEVDIRSQLLHSSAFESVKNSLPPKNQEQVLNQVIDKIKQPHPEDEKYCLANIELFNWLLERDKLFYFEWYPILSSKEKSFTLLSKQSEEKLLAPKDVWNKKAQDYVDLFPQELIISSDYFKKVSQKDKWKKLKDSGFIRIDPLYKEKGKISRDELDSLLLSSEILADDKEHEITADVELSKIAFFEIKDKGIIDTVRKSKEKARKFLYFLFDYVIENDSQWDNPVEVSCECGLKHKIYPASWFGTLKERSWVPVRKDKSEKPNAQFISSLIEKEEELIKKCRQDKPSILLSRLNISISELMMHIASKDDKIKIELDKAIGSLFSTFMKSPNQLSKIAQLAESDPQLFIKIIKKMDEHIQNANEIRRNQDVGTLVENIVKEFLEKETFEVERTGIGSDFVIKIKKGTKECFLEIKSTSQDFVRMTLTQAKEARDNPDKYALCVVRLNGLEIDEETIKSSAKFVTDIGQKLRDKVNDAEKIRGEQEKIAVTGGDIEIEISEGPIHFRINKRIWEVGKTLDQFFTFLREL